MRTKAVVSVLTFLLALSGPAMAVNQNALLNANANAAFLQCGTKHPSAKEAQRLERDFRNPMGGPVMATVGAAMVEATTVVATQEGQRSQGMGLFLSMSGFTSSQTE
jgi:hypothetical protein